MDGFLYPDGIGLPPGVQRGREPQGRFQPAHRRGGQAKAGAADRTLCEVLDSPEYDRERLRILRSFTLISGLVKEVGSYINAGAKKPVHYTATSFVPFLLQVIPAVRMLDIKVFMPKSLGQLIRPKASLSIKRKSGSDKGFLSLADLFAFDWEVAYSEIARLVPLEEFMN